MFTPLTPKKCDKKQILLQYCNEKNIDSNESDLKTMIWSKVETHIKRNVGPVVCEMAKNKIHRIIFSPPYYSNFQPIELVWANLKGTVGRMYDLNTKLSDVKIRLEKAFKNIVGNTIKGCITKTNMVIKLAYEIL
ncbi:hypothetical protein A3Q56_07445 [Intoshia linei]|uniref:Tc1-like transposase DDE domain-containing protein n=1 Tax=Intoshia linei TaxID=1819745 RepID=A0A177AUE8_9BILA|nr:hypothetical protein A3Q56_07445 [Intoshia linei]